MTRAQLRMGKMEFKERLKLEVWRLEGLNWVEKEKFLEDKV